MVQPNCFNQEGQLRINEDGLIIDELGKPRQLETGAEATASWLVQELAKGVNAEARAIQAQLNESPFSNLVYAYYDETKPHGPLLDATGKQVAIETRPSFEQVELDSENEGMTYIVSENGIVKAPGAVYVQRDTAHGMEIYIPQLDFGSSITTDGDNEDEHLSFSYGPTESGASQPSPPPRPELPRPTPMLDIVPVEPSKEEPMPPGVQRNIYEKWSN